MTESGRASEREIKRAQDSAALAAKQAREIRAAGEAASRALQQTARDAVAVERALQRIGAESARSLAATSTFARTLDTAVAGAGRGVAQLAAPSAALEQKMAATPSREPFQLSPALTPALNRISGAASDLTSAAAPALGGFADVSESLAGIVRGNDALRETVGTFVAMGTAIKEIKQIGADSGLTELYGLLQRVNERYTTFRDQRAAAAREAATGGGTGGAAAPGGVVAGGGGRGGATARPGAQPPAAPPAQSAPPSWFVGASRRLEAGVGRRLTAARQWSGSQAARAGSALGRTGSALDRRLGYGLSYNASRVGAFGSSVGRAGSAINQQLGLAGRGSAIASRLPSLSRLGSLGSLARIGSLGARIAMPTALIGSLAGGFIGSKVGGKAGGAISGAAMGAGLGMVAGPIGAAVGAGIGGGIGLLLGGRKEKEQERQKQLQAEARQIRALVRQAQRLEQLGNVSGLRRISREIERMDASSGETAKALRSLQRQIDRSADAISASRFDRALRGVFSPRWNTARGFTRGIVREFSQLSPDLRKKAAEAIAQTAHAMERAGRLPRGSTDKILKDLGTRWDDLPRHLRSVGLESNRAIARTLGDRRAAKSVDDMMRRIHKSFGEFPDETRTTMATAKKDHDRAMAFLERRMERGTAVQREQARLLFDEMNKLGPGAAGASRRAFARAKAEFETGVAGMQRIFTDAQSMLDPAKWTIPAPRYATPDNFKKDKNGNIVFGTYTPTKRRGGLIRRFQDGGLLPALVSPGEQVIHGDSSWTVPGARTAADNVFTMLPAGAAVLTDHGQSLMDGGASLGQALDQQLPHFHAGGVVGRHRKGKKPKGDDDKWVKLGGTTYSDSPPGAFGGDLWGYAELGTARRTDGGGTGFGWLARAFGRSGELPANAEVEFKRNGQTVTLRKRDRGYGQGGDGSTSDSYYAVDFWGSSASKLGINVGWKGDVWARPTSGTFDPNPPGGGGGGGGGSRTVVIAPRKTRPRLIDILRPSYEGAAMEGFERGRARSRFLQRTWAGRDSDLFASSIEGIAPTAADKPRRKTITTPASPSAGASGGDPSVALGSWHGGNTLAWAKALARKHGLSISSTWRSVAHNASVNGVPNSLHTHGSYANPGAVDFVPPSSAALADAQRAGVQEALIHDAGSGLHLHVGFFRRGGLVGRIPRFRNGKNPGRGRARQHFAIGADDWIDANTLAFAQVARGTGGVFRRRQQRLLKLLGDTRRISDQHLDNVVDGVAGLLATMREHAPRAAGTRRIAQVNRFLVGERRRRGAASAAGLVDDVREAGVNQTSKVKESLRDLGDLLHDPSRITYRRMERLRKGVHAEIAELRRRGDSLTGTERVQVRRLQSTLSLLEGEMGYRIGRLVARSDDALARMERRTTATNRRQRIRGVDPDGINGLSRIQEDDERSRAEISATLRGKDGLKAQLRRAKKLRNEDLANAIREQIDQVRDTVAELDATIAERARAITGLRIERTVAGYQRQMDQAVKKRGLTENRLIRDNVDTSSYSGLAELQRADTDARNMTVWGIDRLREQHRAALDSNNHALASQIADQIEAATDTLEQLNTDLAARQHEMRRTQIQTAVDSYEKMLGRASGLRTRKERELVTANVDSGSWSGLAELQRADTDARNLTSWSIDRLREQYAAAANSGDKALADQIAGQIDAATDQLEQLDADLAGRRHEMRRVEIQTAIEGYERTIRNVSSMRTRKDRELVRRGVDPSSSTGLREQQRLAEYQRDTMQWALDSQGGLRAQLAKATQNGDTQLARSISDMIEGYVDEIDQINTDAIQLARDAARKASQELVDAAAYYTGSVQTRQTRMELQQQLDELRGGAKFDSYEARQARADNIRNTLLPALDAELAALRRQMDDEADKNSAEFRAAQSAHEAKQNEILEAQLRAEQEISRNTADAADALKQLGGSLTFSFNNQLFSDVINSGIGA